MRPSRVLPLLALVLSLADNLSAQATLRAAPSARATAEVSLSYPEGQGPAGAKPMVIRLDYGQPHLRGRALNTDSLVPFDTPWRLGANAPTRLVTDVNLTLGGVALAKGTYVLFTLPGRTGWKLIIQKDVGAADGTYDAANDIARGDLRLRRSAEPVESLSMALVPAGGAGAAHGELRIAWGTVALATDWVVR